MAKQINQHSVLQKVKQRNGEYAIVFPITRVQEVYVDLEKKITLSTVLAELTQAETSTNRQNLISDVGSLVSNLSNLLKKPLVLNNFALYDAQSTQQVSYAVSEDELTYEYALKTTIEFGQIMPKKIKIDAFLERNMTNPVGLTVYTTNNAFDTNVVWENASLAFDNKGFHEFTNTVKESANPWGIAFRFVFTRTDANDHIDVHDVTLTYL